MVFAATHAQKDWAIYYGTLIDLITSLLRAQSAGRLAWLVKLAHPSLLALDEIEDLPIGHLDAVSFD
ncbi:MAG: hypothetical protein QJR02_00330 [Sinobacteraceae bacterium]|nr:hypothetical protein [Nevskiaceae bacterium]